MGREDGREKNGENKEQGRKRRKVKSEWRERCIVVHEGTLSLFRCWLSSSEPEREFGIAPMRTRCAVPPLV